jgi:hypothetical protein
VNREKFAERWRDALRSQPSAPGRYDRAAWHALAVRDGRATPTAPARQVEAGSNGGGRR